MKKIMLAILALVLILSLGCEAKPNKKIQGVVVKVDYIFHEGDWTSTSTKKTIIEFQDGRIMVLEGISNFDFWKGKMHTITVDSMYNSISKVEIQQ
jgi:hypothetical protein